MQAFTNPTTLFSYYGGKSKLAHLYQAPLHETVVEPFCGGASYSLRYHDRAVCLNDISPLVVAVWRFLLRPDALDLIHRYVPHEVEAGDEITDMAPADADDGFLWFLRWRAWSGRPFQKINKVSEFGAVKWQSLFPAVDYYLPRIQHWKVTLGSYDALENVNATWFIDPPYSGAAGREYAQPTVNYDALAAWVGSRRGQLIVCEESTASWLPFRPLRSNAHTGGKLNVYSGRRTYTEAVFEREYAD